MSDNDLFTDEDIAVLRNGTLFPPQIRDALADDIERRQESAGNLVEWLTANSALSASGTVMYEIVEGGQ